MTVRVVHVCPDLRTEAGGIAAVLCRLHEEMFTARIDSRLLTYEGALDPDTKAITVPRRALWRSHAKSLAGALPQDAFDGPYVLHSHGLWSPLNHAAVLLARQRGWPVIVSTHGMLLPWALSQKKWRKRLGWRLFQARDLRAAARIHITSNDEAESLRHAGISRQAITIPFGVEAPPPEVESSKNAPPFRVVFLGRIAPIKNLNGLIAAWRDAGLGPDWYLQIAGPDEFDLRASLVEQANSAGIGAQVSFLDPVYGMAKWRLLRGAAALVLPSFSENFGVVVLEALACGVPVIASTGTRWSELPQQGCGWLAEPDRIGLTEALRSMAALSLEERAAMGSRGAQYVEQTYRWKSVTTRFAEIYHRVLLERKQSR